MKKLSIEQKAKAYDGVRDKITLRFGINVADEIFSQFEMSEDERIRKAIIEQLKSRGQGSFAGYPMPTILAWFEKQGKNNMGISEATKKKLEDNLTQALGKETPEFWNKFLDEQGEQKPADKVEPKFHKGEWVVYECGEETATLQITRIVGETYVFSDDSTLGVVDEDTLRLWDITKDAKDGDVLFAENFDNIGGCVFLFKGLDSWKFDAEGDRFIATGYCCTSITESGNTDFGIQGPDCVEIKRVHPASKEQRDALMKAMADAGYTFDFESKELRKIEQYTLIPSEDDIHKWGDNILNHARKVLEQNTAAWSDEDEKMLVEIVKDLQVCKSRDISRAAKDAYQNEIDWLKSLKERYTWKPSEEQIKVCKEVYADILSAKGFDLGTVNSELNRLEEELKELKA